MRKFWMMLLAAMLMSGAGFTMTGCNTLEGAGEDVEETGEAIQRGVDDDDLD